MTHISLLLLRHYVDYLRQPAVALTALIIIASFLYVRRQNRSLVSSQQKSDKIPDCYRLGLSRPSNLSRHQKSIRQPRRNSSIGHALTGDAIVKAIFTYPIKSCRGIELKATEVLSTGLKYDRIFTFAERKPKKGVQPRGPSSINDADYEWRFITQREYPQLALLEMELWVPDPRRSRQGQRSTKSNAVLQTPQLREHDWIENGGCLILKFPETHHRGPIKLPSRHKTSVRIPLAPTKQRAREKGYTTEPLVIWIDTTLGLNMTNEIPVQHQKRLRQFLGVDGPMALFRVDDKNLRPISRSLPQDRPDEEFHVGFTDAFPVHIMNLASVSDVDGLLPDKASMKSDLDPLRFRANIYISGPPAYVEESWKKLKIGRCIQLRSKAHRDRSPAARNGSASGFIETDAEYHVACRTARCKVPNVHQDTAERDVNEPYTTMRHHRDVDPGASPYPCLGMMMIPLFPQGVLRVGDEVEVLERGEHHYEPMF